VKILFDARMLNTTGIGTYTRNILQEFDKSLEDIEVHAVMNKRQIHGLKLGSRVRIIPMPFEVPVYSLTEQVVLPYCSNKIKPDLIHFPNFNTSFLGKFPSVVTIHDMIYYLFPQACPSLPAQVYAKIMLRHSVNRSRMIVTDSLFSKNDIVTHFDINPDKVRVIPVGVNSNYMPVKELGYLYKKYNLPKKFILYLGNHETRKNIVGLLEAYNASRCKGDYFLVIGGKRDRRRREISKTIKNLSLENRVVFTGFVDIKDMPALYSAASLFVFPSFYEGFGLPPLEAMACGTAVICSNRTSLPEAVGDAAVTIDPDNTDAIAEAMDNVLSDDSLKADLINKGFAHIKKFTWKDTVSGLIEIYKETLSL